MLNDVSFVAALVAGVFSFTSPCVLPLVPIFLAHLAGVSVADSSMAARTRLLANAAAYVLGFSLIFVLLGIALGAAGSFVQTADLIAENRLLLVRIGGVLLMVLGVRQLGLISIPFLDRERHLRVGRGTTGTLTSSFMIGVTFGAGWSPCVGPILGIILTMAANSADVIHSGGLLATYSLGLGVPFLIVALAFGSAPGLLRKLNHRLGAVMSVSGAVMLGVGAIMVLGIYERLFVEIVRIAPWTPWEPSL
jgi:cytochrome c-type biogenesis protein